MDHIKQLAFVYKDAFSFSPVEILHQGRKVSSIRIEIKKASPFLTNEELFLRRETLRSQLINLVKSYHEVSVYVYINFNCFWIGLFERAKYKAARRCCCKELAS